ncbi:hypothetical protein GC194_10275 [bacterium]|nr:hypothetical protein [bacterium]
MRKSLLFVLALSLSATFALAQRSYFTSQGEYMFSASAYPGQLSNTSTRIRFTLFPNSEFMYNLDSKGLLGMYFGLGIRNVGFNFGDPEKHKRRALSLGAPLVIKIGDLENDNFFFFGGEAELFFHYKYKDWMPNGSKLKGGEWLSSQLNLFQPSAMAGFCRKHFMVKFKYYFYDFFNQNYTVPGTTNQPYMGYKSNVFYLSFAIRQHIGGNSSDDDDNDNNDGDQGFEFGASKRIHNLYLKRQ